MAIDLSNIREAINREAQEQGLTLPYNVVADLADHVAFIFGQHYTKPVYVVSWDKTPTSPAGFEWFSHVNPAVERFVKLPAGASLHKAMIPGTLDPSREGTGEHRATISAWLQVNGHAPTDAEIMS